MLHCVAVCCSVLQCVAVCCSMLQYVAVCCSVLQYGHSVLQCGHFALLPGDLYCTGSRRPIGCLIFMYKDNYRALFAENDHFYV